VFLYATEKKIYLNKEIKSSIFEFIFWM